MGTCGGNFTTPNGVLTSPLYPENYTNNADCIYTISQPSGSFINLTITALDVDIYSDPFFGYYSYYYNNDDTCNTDYLEIRDGNSQESPLIKYVCGDEIPDPIVSTQNNIWMR